MYIYFLDRVDGYNAPDSYCTLHSLVIRAASEQDARQLAHEDQLSGDIQGMWLDSDITNCTEIGDTLNQKYPGEPEVIITDQYIA